MDTQARIQQRVDGYEQVLRGARGMFEGGPVLGRPDPRCRVLASGKVDSVVGLEEPVSKMLRRVLSTSAW